MQSKRLNPTNIIPLLLHFKLGYVRPIPMQVNFKITLALFTYLLTNFRFKCGQ